MEFLTKVGIDSAAGYFGLVLLVIGGFLFLAGIGVISIQQVTVKRIDLETPWFCVQGSKGI